MLYNHFSRRLRSTSQLIRFAIGATQIYVHWLRIIPFDFLSNHWNRTKTKIERVTFSTSAKENPFLFAFIIINYRAIPIDSYTLQKNVYINAIESSLLSRTGRKTMTNGGRR